VNAKKQEVSESKLWHQQAESNRLLWLCKNGIKVNMEISGKFFEESSIHSSTVIMSKTELSVMQIHKLTTVKMLLVSGALFRKACKITGNKEKIS
jgi:hypothetical protein